MAQQGDAKFIELARAERADERRVLKEIRRLFYGAFGRTVIPTDKKIDEAIRQLEESRKPMYKTAESHARKMVVKGSVEARRHVGAPATVSALTDHEADAAATARAAMKKEIDTRIAQLQRMKAASPAAKVAAFAAMKRAAGNNTARDITYENKNIGYFEEAKESGARLVWITALDERVRHSHRLIHGQIRPAGEKFNNGCRYPHDPLAPISETAGCRCRLRVVTRGMIELGDRTFLMSAA